MKYINSYSLVKSDIPSEQIIAMNGSHDCSITFIDKNNEVRVYEYERYVKKRYAMFSIMFDDRVGYASNEQERISFLNHLKNNLKNQDIRKVLYHDMTQNDAYLIARVFPNASFEHVNHHQSHAIGAIHTSGFDECLVFSIDGGGVDDGRGSTTNVYYYKDEVLNHLFKNGVGFSAGYNLSTVLLSEIPAKVPGDLSTPGRFMGFSAYGNIIEEWLPLFQEMYTTINPGMDALDKICKALNIPNIENSLSGQMSYDFARTSQHAFEIEVFKFVKPYIDEYNVPVIITGGCGLNVLFNQKLYMYLKEKNIPLYVPSNPNDSGLSHGMFMIHNFNLERKEVCFSGMEILDENFVPQNPSEDFSIEKVVKYISEGKIIGIVNGYSEVGPRALGNRSIVCYPAFKDMKDTLNAKVKFREWYRPFAPVCMTSQKDIFFENAPECKYMSYAPMVKEEYRDKLSSITHIDGSARLQTVDDGVFYDILVEMEKQGLIPVILNTSFNIKGFPILTKKEDAIYALNNTQMDYVIMDNKIYGK